MSSPSYTNPSTPRAAQGVSSTVLTGSTMPVSGVYLRSDVIGTQGARRATLFLDITAKMSGNQVTVIPLVSNEQIQPSASGSAWWTMGTTDGTLVTASLSSGTLPSNLGMSYQTKFATAAYAGLKLSFATAVTGTQHDRIRVDVDCASARYLQFLVAETGVTSSASTTSVVTMSCALSA